MSTPASSVSTPASSVSTPASSVSTPASSVSTPVSSVSTPVSSVSTPVSSVSTPASSVSTPASSVSTYSLTPSVLLPAPLMQCPGRALCLRSLSAEIARSFGVSTFVTCSRLVDCCILVFSRRSFRGFPTVLRRGFLCVIFTCLVHLETRAAGCDAHSAAHHNQLTLQVGTTGGDSTQLLLVSSVAERMAIRGRKRASKHKRHFLFASCFCCSGNMFNQEKNMLKIKSARGG